MGSDGKTLVRIDPKSVKIEAIAKVKCAGRLGFSGQDVYLGGTKELRQTISLASRPLEVMTDLTADENDEDEGETPPNHTVDGNI